MNNIVFHSRTTTTTSELLLVVNLLSDEEDRVVYRETDDDEREHLVIITPPSQKLNQPQLSRRQKNERPTSELLRTNIFKITHGTTLFNSSRTILERRASCVPPRIFLNNNLRRKK